MFFIHLFMKFFHSLSLRVFVNNTDDYTSIKTKIQEILDTVDKTSKKKILISEQSVTGFHDKKILILSFIISKEKQVKDLAIFLLSNLSKTQLNELEVDDNCNVYLRFEKDALLSNNYVQTTSGNCFHFTLNIAAYPKNKQTAQKTLESFLNESKSL